MFVYLSELLLFLAIIWWVVYNFESSKKLTEIDAVNIEKMITEINGKKYKVIEVNQKNHEKSGTIYKEMVLEFSPGELNPDLCQILNQK